MPFPTSLTRLLLLPALAAGLLFTAASCEKTVDLDLKTSASQLVIQADLADDGRPVQASITRSINFQETNDFPVVGGAVVTLTDDAGQAETLREISPGQYRGQALRGVVGHTYTLRVEVDGAAYVAVSTLPAPVPFAGLRTEKPLFVDEDQPDERQAVVVFTDPPGLGNRYRFRQFRNGRLNNSIFVREDEFIDGQAVAQTLRSRTDDPDNLDQLLVGDSLTVEMQTIDAGTYEYFRTLNQIANGSGAFSAAPTNPQSNFSGNVLGYFSAHSQQRRTVLVGRE